MNDLVKDKNNNLGRVIDLFNNIAYVFINNKVIRYNVKELELIY
jgi:hypothetical protein